MNFNEINSVQDLIKMNEVVDDAPFSEVAKGKELLKEVYKMDPAIGRAMAIHILENLLGMHTSMVERNMEAGDTHYALLWQTDAVKLDNAITLVKEVVLKDDDGNVIEYDDIHN